MPGLPPTRRAGGARQNVSYRVALLRGEIELTAWALNLSRGGLRAILEERVELGEDVEVHIDEIQVAAARPRGVDAGRARRHHRGDLVLRAPGGPAGRRFRRLHRDRPGALATKLGMTEAELKAALDDTDPVGAAAQGAMGETPPRNAPVTARLDAG